MTRTGFHKGGSPCYENDMVGALLFDLDNTLYPSSAAMEGFIIDRMNEYVARVTGLPLDEARETRRVRMPNYGTTLEWLMAEHGFSDPDDYFAYVHPEGEEDSIEYDPALPPFLDSLPQPKYVFTNAPLEHANRVLRKLRVEDRFERVFDVRFNGLRGKPARDAVDRVVAAIGLPAARIAFVDDVPRYVRGFTDAGGVGVLIDPEDRHRGSGLPTIRTIYELGAALARLAETP